ncbi:MAG: response regulator transcription factor, partial [Chthoniobacterales bacterium]|nr:response regulator transcription factor [Chthoniobacterales bacterium]
MKHPKNPPAGTNAKKRAILLVDDHPLFRKGMTQLLDSQNDLQVVTEADSTRSALNAIRSKRFDLAVVDIGLRGGANGIELTKSIKAERPDLPV